MKRKQDFGFFFIFYVFNNKKRVFYDKKLATCFLYSDITRCPYLVR